ncbi:MAG: hypothetical protein ABJA18_09830 [bacterium]
MLKSFWARANTVIALDHESLKEDMAMQRILVFLVALIFLASCGGRSNVTAELVPLDKVCAYEKWKTVAVEG